ncbi:rod shape-determining protein RodA [Prochlorococcus sp. MIT 1300]|uniref:rod shape-determining protein RodA n=1 Tax=Prochlorococcus sp. MIT 1300 TaxID=3096218 RepID=UPI002A74FD8B|nr:rod shape-determining protein RodA [Prochlorococcus sp. MIT 1300]
MFARLERRTKAYFYRRSGFTKKLEENDLILWGCSIFLVALAGILIASTQRQANYADWYQHWITAGVGVFLAIQLQRIPLHLIRPLLIPIYCLTSFSLIAVRIIGSSALGAQRWINIGGFNVQPSEFAKLAAILLLAAVLERFPIGKAIDLLRPISVISMPWLLVFIQPDLGTSLVFGAVLIAMLYWAGMPLEWVFLSFSPLITAVFSGIFPWALLVWIPLIVFLAYRSFFNRLAASWITILLQIVVAFSTPWIWNNLLKDYQRDRLILFLDPSKDPLGGGYHLLQSSVGIGSGGIFGTGLLQGQLTKLRFIPEQHTDFIFSALGEETGFVGTIFVLVVFLLFIWRLLKIARQARTDFESLVVVGIGTMLMFQVIVNISMTIGLGPVTGIPLPFLSYGRSALLTNFLALGFCLSVSRSSRTISRNW